MSILARARAYLVALAVWVVLVVIAGDPPKGGTYSEAVLTFGRGVGYLTGYLLLVSVVRALWPLRSSTADPLKLIGGGMTYRIGTFTGTTGNVSKLAVTQTSGSGYVTGSNGLVHGQMTINSTTTVHDQFFLADPSGRQQGFQVQGPDLPLGNDQLVSAAWTTVRGKRRYVMFVNHNTNTVIYPWLDLARLALGGLVGLSVLWALLSGFFLLLGGYVVAPFAAFASLLVFGIAPRLQIRMFRRSASRPLLAALNAEGEQTQEIFAAQAARSAATTAPAMPPPRPPAAPPSTPPGWHADPYTRHERRYWDGVRWTEHVVDADVTSVDPA